MEVVSSADLTISYDGDNVRTGAMDVNQLAPALLAASTLFQKTNRILNGESVTTNLRVRSDFKQGSFDIRLILDQGIIEHAKQLLALHPAVKDAKDLLDLLFFYLGLPGVVVSGLFKLIKLFKGAKTDELTIERNGDVLIISFGEQKVAVHKSTWDLYRDPEIRRAAEAMVSPLNVEGVDRLEIRRGDEIETVTKNEAAAFAYSDLEGEQLIDAVSEAWLRIISLSFNPDHKWRFSTGKGGINFSANVYDSEFWDRVHKNQIHFTEGDQLLVLLRTISTRDDEGELRGRYEVQKVLRHVNNPRQARFDME